ncbi:MAG: carbon-nitrogen hydrolase family protein [Promethearchaeota archaeon]
MKVACLQPKVFNSIRQSYLEVKKVTKSLIEKGNHPDIVCLPERWVPFLKDIPKNFQKERGEHYSFIKNLAKEYNINLLSGAIWEKRGEQNKPSITCYYINQNGEEIGRQDKIHLYSYEKKHFKSGTELNLFKLKDIYFSVLICFDMAFFETPRLAAENGADILFSPTQIREEGMKNWKIYLQARALENRIPIVACNTLGNFNDRIFPGNSKILSFIKGSYSPSKLKIVEAPINSSGFAYDEIDLKFPKKLRKIRFAEKIDISKIKIVKYN